MPKFLSKRSLVLILMALVLFVAVTVLTIWVSTSVYVQRSDSGVIRKIAFWLPAAKIGSHNITYGEFLTTRDTVRRYLNSSAAQDMALSQPVTAEVEKNALLRLIRERIVTDLAQEKGVVVSDEEVRNAFTTMVADTSSTIPNVAQYLSENFGWTEEEYRSKVIRPVLLEERVAETFSSSTDQSLKMEEYVSDRMAKPDVKIYLKFE